MTDQGRLPDPEAAVRKLPRGSAVIVRDPGWPEREMLARRLRPICRARRLKLMIAADARLAYALGAHGLHLPERQLIAGRRVWRRWRRPGFLITAAAHGSRALVTAQRLGVDAVLLSPVFPTSSHPGRPALGALRFARLVRLSTVAVYALGGITAATARRLSGSGVAGFAGISAIATLKRMAAFKVADSSPRP